MQINATNNLMPLPEPQRKTSTHEGACVPETEFNRSAAIERQLADIPDIRANKVAQTRALVETRGYPPEETIRRIADLMAVSPTSGASTHEANLP